MRKAYGIIFSILFLINLIFITPKITAPTFVVETDFVERMCTNLEVTQDGKIQLMTLEEDDIFDDFSDNSKIDRTENLVISNTHGTVQLNKCYQTFSGLDGGTGKSLIKTSDGGYLVVGSYKNTENNNVWITKINEFIAQQWVGIFTKKSGDTARGYDAVETTDGGYIITGTIELKNTDNTDLWIIKTDPMGEKVWEKTYGGNGDDYCRCIQKTFDGGYILIGTTSSFGAGGFDIWQIKVDQNGNEMWNKTFGGDKDDYGRSAVETTNGDFIFTGYMGSPSDGQGDMFLIKTDGNGDVIWNQTYGGSGDDGGREILKADDGCFIIVGETGTYGRGGYDLWMMKLDEDGIEIWNKTFGGTDEDYANAIQATEDNGYIMVGGTDSYGYGERNVWLLKTDEYGNHLWNQTFSGWNNDYGTALEITQDGGFMLVGTTKSFGDRGIDALVVKTDSRGKCLYSNGSITSTNLFEKRRITSIISFNYSCKIPRDTQLNVQFSKNEIDWCNSHGILNEHDSMTDGSGSINLTGLGWSETAFYYKVLFHSDGILCPTLSEIRISYDTDYHDYCASGTYTSPVITVQGENFLWKKISWDGISDEDTEIRFQMDMGETSDRMHGWFTGPDGSEDSYYTTSGTDIWAGHRDYRCLGYVLFLSTNDSSKTPIVDNITISYNVLPYISINPVPTYEDEALVIEYLLYDDERDAVDIRVEFLSHEGGYMDATMGSGGDGTTNLATSPGGFFHTFIWDYQSDSGKVKSGGIPIRITPSDEDFRESSIIIIYFNEIDFGDDDLPIVIDPNDDLPPDDDKHGKENGDEIKDSSFKIPWTWIVIAGGVFLILIVILLVRRSRVDDWDDEDDEDDELDVLESLKRKQIKQGIGKKEEKGHEVFSPKEDPVAVRQRGKKCIKCNDLIISRDAVFCTTCGANQSQSRIPSTSVPMNRCIDCGTPVQPPLIFCDPCVMKQTQACLPTDPASHPITGRYVQQQQVSNIPVAQQRYAPVQTQPASPPFIQPAQAPVQPMVQQGYVPPQQVPLPAPMFPPVQKQDPPAPPPPVPPGYGGLQ